MKKLMLFFASLLLFAGAQTLQAQRTVSGTVVHADDRQGIPGVSVVVKGTTVGTTTNVDGKYTLNVPAGTTYLVFSFMGMKTQEIAIEGKNTIDVVMQSSATALEGVVITALGINRSEKSLGFSTSNVGSEELVQKSEPDALRALEGKVPGMEISGTGGAAGSSTRIIIRGTSSFFGNNQPLFVVDGVPYSNETIGAGSTQLIESGGAYGNSFNTLDPNDIESMQVLKGAAASALYGSRAANGVVLITTKSGSKTRRPSQKGMEITLQSSFAWEKVSALPDYQNKYGAGSLFVPTGANGSWGGLLDVGDYIPADTWGQYYAAYPELFPSGKIPYNSHPNNVKDLFQTGFMQDYSVNVSSQNDKGVFNVTASHLGQTGYIPNSEFKRTSVSVGGNNRLDNRFKISGNVAFSNTDQLGSTFGNQQFSGQSSSFGRTLIMARNWDISLPYEDKQGRSVSWVGDQTDHPIWAVHHNTIRTQMNRMVSQASVGYDIFSWLNVNYQLGYNAIFQDRKSIIDIGSRAAAGLGKIDQFNYQNHELESNLLLTVTQMLTKDLSLQAILGNNINQRRTKTLQGGGTEFIVPSVFNITNVKNPATFSSSTERRLAAMFADISLGYRNYLFLNLTGRNDWSSTLPTENRSYFYPAVTGSFVATDAFPQIKSDYLSGARLRMGWAKVGNDAGVYYDYYNQYYTIGTSLFGQPTMSIPWITYDQNLKPEFTSEIEIGGNFGFWKNRINLDLAWYNRKTTNQIAPLLLPGSSGKTSYYTNFGEVENKGVEITLDANIIKEKNFEWNMTWVFGQNESNVISLYGDSKDPLTMATGCSNCPTPILEPGKPYGYLRGTVAYRDADGSLLIQPNGLLRTSSEEAMIANPYPKFKTSLIPSFKIFGVTLSFLFDYQKGGDIYSVPIQGILGRGVSKFNEDRDGGRIIPGYYADPNDPSKPLLDANGNRIENITVVTEQDLWFTDGFGVNSADEFSVFDATNIRLREISIGYALPKQWLRKLPIGSLEVSFSARNLWFYAPNLPKHVNVDPVGNTFGASSNITGMQYDIAPSAKRYGINLKFTF